MSLYTTLLLSEVIVYFLVQSMDQKDLFNNSSYFFWVYTERALKKQHHKNENINAF